MQVFKAVLSHTEVTWVCNYNLKSYASHAIWHVQIIVMLTFTYTPKLQNYSFGRAMQNGNGKLVYASVKGVPISKVIRVLASAVRPHIMSYQFTFKFKHYQLPMNYQNKIPTKRKMLTFFYDNVMGKLIL